MIHKISIYETFTLDPYRNLATEKYLLDSVQPGQCILYLWQNQNTVVIGKNQNAWAECRTALLEEEGGHLARRLSGGGAVFHDTGNLNFTFLLRLEDYDLHRQLRVIQQACRLAGIETEISGRNDLLTDGKKFSGNAFYQTHGLAYHHGTLLIDADLQKLSRYLSPPKAKLEAKGIASVRSRVVNLRSLAPKLTCEQMRTYMKSAFSEIYALEPEILPEFSLENPCISSLAALYASWEYLYGTPLPLTFQCAQKFSWGYIQIQLRVQNGVVLGAKVYTDSMDWNLSTQIEYALIGSKFLLSDLISQLQRNLPDKTVAEDLAVLLAQQGI